MNVIMVLLAIAGILLPIISVIIFLIALIKHKSKKKPLIIFIAGILCFILAFVIATKTDSGDSTSDNGNTTTETDSNNSIDKLMKEAILQYPASNENFKYNVYDTYIEITEYIGPKKVDTLVVPATLENLPVYEIDSSTFDNSCEIKNLIFEDGIYRIHQKFGAVGVTNVTLPSTLAFVGALSFEHCYSLESIVIPEGISSIQFGAFQHCSSLKEITLPSTLKTISSDTFAFCTSLKTVNLPNSLETIGESAFVSCKKLEYITIPSSVTEIQASAFQSSGLKSIEIPANVLKIGGGVFTACDSLKEVKFYNSDIEIVADGIVTSLFSQCPDDLVVYGKPASTIARACANENVYFQTF